MKRFNRFCRWFAYNAFWYLMGALGLVGMGWAFHIFTFLAWMTFLFTILLTLYKSNCKKTGEKYEIEKALPLPVPFWLDFLLDIIMALALAAFGHWFYAVMIIFSEVLFADIIKPIEACVFVVQRTERRSPKS